MVAQKLPRSVAEKLEAIPIAAQYDSPTCDIDSMLAEIEGRSATSEANPAPSKNEPCKNR